MLRPTLLLLLAAALALLGPFAFAGTPGKVDLIGWKLPTRQRCGQSVWLAAKIIPRTFGDAEELYCGFENPDYNVAGFTLKDRVTRFKHFNPSKYYMTMGAKLDRVFWEFGKQGFPFIKDKEFLFKAKVALNRTGIATSSYTWELVCEWKWANETTDPEVVDFEKTSTVRITSCNK